jgi:hypothetical protein
LAAYSGPVVCGVCVRAATLVFPVPCSVRLTLQGTGNTRHSPIHKILTMYFNYHFN